MIGFHQQQSHQSKSPPQKRRYHSNVICIVILLLLLRIVQCYPYSTVSYCFTVLYTPFIHNQIKNFDISTPEPIQYFIHRIFISMAIQMDSLLKFVRMHKVPNLNQFRTKINRQNQNHTAP